MTTGGGASHVATANGVLRALGSTSNVILIAGGGGGAYQYGDTKRQGAEAGGKKGSNSDSGSQTDGYIFGQGEYGNAGGGGGLYGGYTQGGAGSGYIGNQNLSNKQMVAYYGCPTSSDTDTKTSTTEDVSSTCKAKTPKSGDGGVVFTFIEE